MSREPTTPQLIEPAAFEPLAGAPAAERRRRHPLRWLLGGTALVFLLVMLFLFNARSLLVTASAETPVTIDIHGLALPFGTRYLMLPGDYSASARAEGYHPLQQDFTVTDTDGQQLALVLAPLPGRVSITTTPAGARVRVDGEDIGASPLQDAPLEAGERQLAIVAERYFEHTQTLVVTGREVQQALTVELVPAWADITMASIPAGADILVDGDVVGSTPATVPIIQGERQLLLRLPAHADHLATLDITAGVAMDLGTITLAPAPGLLALASRPAGANVTLDGEYQGQTPLELAISPGRPHQLAVFKPGYRRFSDSISMAAAATAEREVTLQPRLGEIELDIQPAQAEVRVNGRLVGSGSRNLSLPAVEQRLEISLAGHATVTRRVTPRPGLPQKLSVALLTEQAARMAKILPRIESPAGQALLLFEPERVGPAEFTLGASRREPGRRSNEVLRPVRLQRMFYLASHEVTNAQFRLFEAGHNSGQVRGASLNREDQPVVGVSWQQAASYCNWLSRKEGLPPFYREDRGIIVGFDPASTGYRLPSEAEWAWAARTNGDTLLKFPWGDNFPPSATAENYADAGAARITGRVLPGYRDDHLVSAPIGSYGANQRGLYDMGGNVAEWVNDVYTVPAEGGSAAVDPLGEQRGDNYTIRGASWSHSRIAELRLSYRDYGQAGRDDVGFRIARYAE